MHVHVDSSSGEASACQFMCMCMHRNSFRQGSAWVCHCCKTETIPAAFASGEYTSTSSSNCRDHGFSQG